MSAPVDVRAWIDHAAHLAVVAFDRDPEAARAEAAVDEPVRAALDALHLHNATLWGFEDEVRRDDIGDAAIAQWKRRIDAENQARNDAIDRVDRALRERLAADGRVDDPALPLNTETPGGAFDRLSILVLRRRALDAEAGRTDADGAHRERSARRRAEVAERIDDLAGSLSALLDDIFAGRKRLKSYATHKLYNDPETNPAVRNANRKARGPSA
ncbi:MAG: DUF4254 domain-containing protein [Planctomycetota bacterium]